MKARPANTAERKHWQAIIELGCAIKSFGNCQGRPTIHHCGTGGGGRKNHMKVICLCWGHHLGPEGIDSIQGKRISKRAWQEKYGSEEKLLKETAEKIS